MGKLMCINLLQAGYEVVVYDLIDEAMNAVVNFGAAKAGSPKEVAQSSELVFTSLPTPEDLEDVVLGVNGLLEGARKGCILVDTSTVSPSTIKRISDIASEKGVRILEAPVSGGVIGAKAGTLTIMVGGEKSVFEECFEILQVIGGNIYHVGHVGSGNTVKLVNNLISLVNVVVLSEGMILGVKAGVDPKTLYDVIKVSSGNSYALEVKLPKYIFKGNFEAGFALDLASKDLELALELGRDIGLPLSVTRVAMRVYESAKAKGMGHLDHTAVIRMLEAEAQVEVRY
jgi:3-hydroxyisobutyrate dehydrogenase-like beta-hydroxyacid dehydrogenase